MSIGRMLAWLLTFAALTGTASGQAYGPPDRDQPGDGMIQSYLGRIADELDARFLDGIHTADDWEKRRADLRGEYLSMLGLSPLPARTPLQAAVTGTIEGDG